MRTTIRIDDALLKEAKSVAAASGKSLTELVEDALRESLRRRQAASQRERVRLHTFKGGYLQPGVDLDDSSALLDIMERGDATP